LLLSVSWKFINLLIKLCNSYPPPPTVHRKGRLDVCAYPFLCMEEITEGYIRRKYDLRGR